MTDDDANTAQEEILKAAIPGSGLRVRPGTKEDLEDDE